MRKIILFTSVALLFISSCKKKDDFAKYSDQYIHEGFIDYTVKGISSDSVALNESFHATIAYNNSIAGGSYNEANDTSLHFSIYRRVDYDGSNSQSINFDYNPQTKSVKNESLFLHLYKKLDGNKVCDLAQYPGTTDSKVISVTFDDANGRINGSFSYTITSDITHVLNVSGTFDVKVYKIYN